MRIVSSKGEYKVIFKKSEDVKLMDEFETCDLNEELDGLFYIEKDFNIYKNDFSISSRGKYKLYDSMEFSNDGEITYYHYSSLSAADPIKVIF